MENIVELVVFALFILASLLGGRRKGGAGSKPKGESPDARRSKRGDAADRREGPVRAGADVRAEGEERESAATMVPDDLWSVLTGEPRAPEGPGSGGAREPEPVPAGGGGSTGPFGEPAGADATPDRAEWSHEPASPRSAEWDEEARSLETIPEPDYPRVVSLEQQPLPPEVRRELALERSRAEPDRRPSTSRPRRLPLRLHDRDAVRRAFVLREVLGPPKGLDL